MRIPQIRLQQTYAQIGLNISQPRQEIEQKPADMQIKQNSSKMTIDRTPSKLTIDQDQAWGELGFKPTSELSREFADAGYQAAIEAIGEIASEGDQLAAIEQHSDAFVAIATEKGNPPPADFNIAFIPSHGSVKIDYTPSEVRINWERGGAVIEVNPNKTIHNYTPGKTEVYLRQMNQLQIDFVV
ncbi:DUF6470 family protein [Neobacillus sp. K501]